jgi:hypothetical protein
MNKPPSPETLARLERKRLAVEEGAKAMQEVLAAAIAVRVNMERLRALRLAKEANGVKTEIATSNQPNAKRKRF